MDATSGEAAATVAEFAPTPGKPVRTTLDYAVQTAAEAAVAGQQKPTAVVAVDARSGEVLVVANGPEVSAGYNRAFVGRYPPGSTFKAVTTAALLEAGLDPDETVPCPRPVSVSGKPFENYDGLGAMGSVPFRLDFTESCNTAFVAKSKDLSPDALADAARQFGIGGDWELALDAFAGSVPRARAHVRHPAGEDGATATEIMNLLGHASLTIRAYIDATAREQREAARANRTYRTLAQLTDPDRVAREDA